MKRPLLRLFAAIVTLFAVLAELAVRMIQLLILLVVRLSRRLETRQPTLEAPQVQTCLPVASPAPLVAPAPPLLAPPDAEARLIGALTGPSLGFPVRSARAFAATVRTRLATEPMDKLVREGISRLTTCTN